LIPQRFFGMLASHMENESLVQRDAQLLQQAMGIGQNLSFILVFATAAFFAVLGVITVIASCLDYNIEAPHNFEGVSISGVVMLVVLAIFNAFDYLTKIGDKVALISWSVVCLLIGIFTMAVCVYVWMGLGGAA